MPFGKSFNVVLESASESENDAFVILDGTTEYEMVLHGTIRY